MALTFEQFKKLRDEGLTINQIIKFEKGEIPLTTPILTKEKEEELKSSIENRALFPAKTGESPIIAGLKATGNVPSSLVNLAFNLGGALLSPIETGKGIFKTIKGAGAALGRKAAEAGLLGERAEEKIKEIPKLEEEQIFNQVINSLKERYGSLEAAQRTATNDPFGFGLDVMAILSATPGAKTLLRESRLAPQAFRAKIARNLELGAEKRITEAFAPTKEFTKTLTKKIAPELRKRKIIAFSKEGLSSKIAQELETAGNKLNIELAKILPETQVKIKPIIDALEESKNQFLVKGTDIIAEPQAFKAASELQEIVAKLGDKASFESLRSLRQIWDKAVAKSKGFQKQLSDLDKLDIKKDATNAIRNELAKEFPDVAKINAEYSLWKNAETVINETLRRTTGQKLPLSQRLGQAAGRGVGLTKGLWEAIIYGELLKNAIGFFQSTAWKTVSAASKQKLAEALIEGNKVKANRILMAMMINKGQLTRKEANKILRAN
jgi:hypothetical protein